MTSSLRNSLHRRNHKERSQLAHRTKLGILEKHKDYVQRAKDYHSKQDRLNRLRQKAAERNKDEFYFSMVKEKTRKGVHVKDRGNAALPVDIVKVLKTQDENYVRTMRASNTKKIDSLKNQLRTMADLIKDPLNEDDEEGLEEDERKILREAGILQSSAKASGKRKAQHIVFADSAEEARQFAKRSKSKRFSTTDTPSPDSQQPEIDLGWKTGEPKRKRRESLHTPRADIPSRGIAGNNDLGADDLDTADNGPQSTTSTKHRLLKELSARLRRDTQLRYAQREFEMQRLLMGKGARAKIAGVEKINGDSESEEDEDEIDARKGRRRSNSKKVDEETYKPRVYKWKMERKR
ncbi:u3 small nucleolar RNA-associated protein 11 [Macrolepiota fuliginosa MF-IS2]|uniref:U3 small nucleolar RNA-associated protein 11 n=1 Tax=Macrolepiota fuliginosa MF-IS2 TaxID=1400762 RepID=A0A9P5XNL2_9AGAR|nr:u3 small nucleolar RNA-associated protein 11 [Macrolepiota fuliginosa MF-IS2]